jgi:hypothetical protein
MSRSINFENRIINVPDDATDDEVAAIIESSLPVAQQVAAPALTTMQQFQAGARADQTKRKTAPIIGPLGQIEGGMNAISGMGSSVAGGLAGIAGAMLPGPQGQGADWARSIQDMGTYQPRSDAGKAASEFIASPSVFNDASKYLGGKLGSLMGAENAGELAGEVVPSIVGSLFGIRSPVKRIATTPYRQHQREQLRTLRSLMLRRQLPIRIGRHRRVLTP